MIGNAADAAIAFDKHMNGRKPRGWHYLAEGCTRTAYLSPDKVVYKVGDSDVNLEESASARRYRVSKKLAKLNVFVPPARTYRVPGGEYVMAMGYIKRHGRVHCAKEDIDWKAKPYGKVYFECDCNPTPTRPCFSELIDKLNDLRIYDMWEENLLMTQDERFHIIDLGAIA